MVFNPNNFSIFGLHCNAKKVYIFNSLQLKFIIINSHVASNRIRFNKSIMQLLRLIKQLNIQAIQQTHSFIFCKLSLSNFIIKHVDIVINCFRKVRA